MQNDPFHSRDKCNHLSPTLYHRLPPHKKPPLPIILTSKKDRFRDKQPIIDIIQYNSPFIFFTHFSSPRQALNVPIF
jgi:hypothetical protein